MKRRTGRGGQWEQDIAQLSFIRQVKSAFLIKLPGAITPCRRLRPPLNYGLIILLANFYTAQFMARRHFDL